MRGLNSLGYHGIDRQFPVFARQIRYQALSRSFGKILPVDPPPATHLPRCRSPYLSRPAGVPPMTTAWPSLLIVPLLLSMVLLHPVSHGQLPKIASRLLTPSNWANKDAIGICLVGNFNNTLPTDRQMQSLLELVRFLQNRYSIPKSRIYGHNSTPGARVTDCPGKKFPMARLKSMLDD